MRKISGILCTLLFFSFSAMAMQVENPKQKKREDVSKNERRTKIVDDYSRAGKFHQANAMEAAKFHQNAAQEVAETAAVLRGQNLSAHQWQELKKILKDFAGEEVKFYREKAKEVKKYGKGDYKLLRKRTEAEVRYFANAAKEVKEEYKELGEQLSQLKKTNDSRRLFSFLKNLEKRHKHREQEALARVRHLEAWSKVNPGG